MAINDPSKNAPASQGPSFTPDGGASAAAPQVQTPVQPTTPTRTFGNLLSTPLGRYSGSESIKELHNKLDETYKNLPSDQFEYSLLNLDNQNFKGLAFGVLAFYLINKRLNNRLVTVHSLIVEATSAPLQPRQINQAGVQVEVLNTPMAAWDEALIAVVKGAVADKYRNMQLVMVDATVVPRTFNPAVPELLHRLAYNTLVACTTEIDVRQPGFLDVNLATMQKGNLTVSMTVAQKQETDDVGLPNRSNVEVVYQDNISNGNQNNGQPYSVNTQERSTTIGSFNGFIDFSWAPTLTAPAYAQAYAQQQLGNGLLPTQKFAARFVITNVNALAIATAPAVLNLLAPMTAIVEDMTWVQTFMNRGVKSRFHDIGGLNIEGNLGGDPANMGKKIDTSSDDFKPEMLYSTVAQLVRPGLAIALDVPDAGPQTWFLSLFANAANGSTVAQDLIIAAANTLTANNFGRFFQGPSIFIDQGNRVHLGHYDNNGVLEDIRNVDYLAVANTKGVDNVEILRKFTDTFTATDYLTQERRLDERARIIREVVPSVVFTGMATRCTFSPEFIAALWNGIKACGVSPTVQRHGMSTGPQVNRASAGFAQNGLIMPGTIQAFNQGTTSNAARFVGGGVLPTGRY